ncbi:MAG: cytochrome c3 family protein, partial [Desulfofustis sp.]|nr:cytochrome c3 family protein [Desulfofustis sp.]
GTYQHPPYAEKECDSCHRSDQPSADDIVSETPDLCYNCHDAYEGEFMHSPSSLGECLICHDPHASDQRFLLNEKEPDLCYLCHDQIEGLMTDKRNATHAPAVDNCTACHNPHVSEVGSTLLKEQVKPLCTGCHAEEGVDLPVDINGVAYKHGPLETDSSCLNCHDPHATIFENHLLAEPMDLCLRCHNQEVIAYDGSALTDINTLLQENKFHHGPIKEKNCSGCHSPHGSDYYRILVADYPNKFYTDTFNADDYKLFFSCHESTLLKDSKTTTLTNFRDGDRNLHYLHVNREKKGRTCRACHEVHASNHFNHIRDAVPFGKINWPLPLKYQPIYTDMKSGEPCSNPSDTCVKTGGSCVACHARKAYDNRAK